MDLNNVNSGLTGFSGMLNSFTGWISKMASWMFTFKNMMFFFLIAGIIFIAWKLFENDVKRKRYNYGRRREV